MCIRDSPKHFSNKGIISYSKELVINKEMATGELDPQYKYLEPYHAEFDKLI